MSSCYLIINPSSHGGKSRKVIKNILELLDQTRISYDYHITVSIQDAYEHSVEANKNNYGKIIAVGGDGTINAVINGFYNPDGKRISRSRFGVIYTGTSPDFCKSYGIPTSFDQAVKVIANGGSTKIKIGKIMLSPDNKKSLHHKFIRDNPDAIVRYFGCCANIGLGASIARIANSGIRKYLGDFTGTFLALIKVLFSFRPSDQVLMKDGEMKVIRRVYNISTGLTKFIASGIKVNHNLDNNDERFYCLQVNDLKLMNIPALIKKVYGGRPISNTNYLSLNYANILEIPGNFANPEIEFDGDPAGFLPCKIEIAKEPLDLIK